MIKLQSTISPHVIYHWWCDDPNIKPYQSTRSPVVASIACLRAHCPNVDITVLDASCQMRSKSDWGEFPELLNFKIEQCMPFIKKSHINLWQKTYKKKDTICDLRLASRIWDVEKYAKKLKENKILFLDSDIFCVSNPFPDLIKHHNSDDFYCLNGNTGVWLYNKSKESDVFFDIWKATTSRILIGDRRFFNEVKKKTNYESFNDEMTYLYITKKYIKINNYLKPNFNFIIKYLGTDDKLGYLKYHKLDAGEVKFIHACDSNMFKDKILLCSKINEIKNSIKTSLDNYYYNLIFEYYINVKSFSLNKIFNMSKKSFKTHFEQQ
jgi:hypothetical protein